MRTFAAALFITLAVSFAGASELLIDDFSEPGTSALGTQWQGFTDRVMGGRSTIEAGYLEQGDELVLAMRGEVSLANNGGFVQVRLPLAARGTFDASAYSGIALEVRGNAGPYFIHLRTVRTRRPWQHFVAPLAVTEEWERVVVPFSAFEGDSIRGRLDTETLRSIGIVAGKEEFTANIQIRRMELVR